MRELKFRYILKYQDSLVKFHLSLQNISNGNVGSAVKTIDEDLKKFELVSVDQYIGSKDKNDKDIYEGDIGKNGSIIEYVTEKEVFTRFSGGGEYNNYEKITGFVLNDGDGGYELIYSEDFESIGNIHENPELIEVVI